jgi:hypothetical protein
MLFAFVVTYGGAAVAQVRPPEEGGVAKSMGQPPIWKWYGGATAGSYRPDDGGVFDAYGTVALYKDLMSPMTTLIGLWLEGYAGVRSEELDGGARLQLFSPFLRLGAGVDVAVADEESDFILSFMHPLRRGGVFGKGDFFRIDWLPGRGNSFNIGFTFPLNQPAMGETRPQRDYVRLEKRKEVPIDFVNADSTLDGALNNVRDTAHWVSRLTTPFIDQNGRSRGRALEGFGREIAEIKAHLAETGPLFPDGRSSLAEIHVYHRELDRAFSIAASNVSLGVGETTDLGRRVSALAKEALLEEVLLPYNRLLGQRKKSDTILAFERYARGNFATKIHIESDLPGERVNAVMWVFKELIHLIDDLRKYNHDQWGRSDFVWLPLQLGLLPEQYDDRAEMNRLIERATAEKFSQGNRAWYVIRAQFQWEVARMLEAAEDYHVLWIHDIRGENAAGEPDQITFRQVVHYIDTMTKRVREYDDRGKLPMYIILMDQFYYDGNKSRKWISLLEDPMHYEMKLPKGSESMEETIQEAQRNLRDAAANSTLLQAQAKEYGKKWLKSMIKVQVNITNPVDPSFWSRQLILFWGMPDNVIRDHRKICFYDITEADPYKGMAVYSGMGIGQHYVGSAWEDRGIMTQGPATLEVKNAARELLLNQGFVPEDIPHPLQPKPKPAHYDSLARANVERDQTFGFSMELHNKNGYAPKPVDVAKAVLYTMMPPGSIMKTPDSLWNAPLWASMLLGKALRGGRVFLINPSADNSPGQGALVQTRTQELFERMIIAQRELGPEISAAGGQLMTGMYDIDVDVDDVIGRARIAMQNLQKYPFLKELYGFHSDVYDLLGNMKDELPPDFHIEHLAADVEVRKPKLHLKTHLFVTGPAWQKLLARPEWADLMRAYLRERLNHVEHAGVYEDITALPAKLRPITVPMWQGFLDSLTPEEQESSMAFLLVGSHNQNYRSVVMDGEVAIVQSGRNSLIALVDFFSLTLAATWVDTEEELEQYLPRSGNFWRQISRWIKTAL